MQDWVTCELTRIAATLTDSGSGRRRVIAVDGRSGSGKSTFARALAAHIDAALLSTDDFAWWHSLFDWTDLLIENGIEPLLAGRAVDYRPPAWSERDRPGSITAPARSFIVVEGVGAAQEQMRSVTDVVVWVQSDADEAERRGIERDLAERPDPDEAKRFWDEWQAAEIPFQEAQATWTVADLIVCGTPTAVGPDPAPRWLCGGAELSPRREQVAP